MRGDNDIRPPSLMRAILYTLGALAAFAMMAQIVLGR
jgi:hypothetical protein